MPYVKKDIMQRSRAKPLSFKRGALLYLYIKITCPKPSAIPEYQYLLPKTELLGA